MFHTLKCSLLVALMGAAAPTAFAVNTSSKEYKEAYACGIEAVKAEMGPVAFCVGNAYDPSPTQMNAYAAAERDAKKGGSSAVVVDNACPFAYGLYQANGSHADGFAEGPQKILTLRNVAHMISGRSITLYDSKNQIIPASLANSLFVKKGDDFVVSSVAQKNCSKKQLGKNAYGG